MRELDRLILRVSMKIFGILGLVLAVGFAIMLIMPVFDLQDEAVAIPGLGDPALTLYNNVGNLVVIVVGIAATVFLIGAVMWAAKR